ncbi:MAG: hypothetical protein ACOYMA_08395 [Bacteroidia bacterium]
MLDFVVTARHETISLFVAGSAIASVLACNYQLLLANFNIRSTATKFQRIGIFKMLSEALVFSHCRRLRMQLSFIDVGEDANIG